MYTWTSHVTSWTVTSIEMYLRTEFPYLYISIYRYSHLNKLSMVSLFCSSGTFSKEKCNIRYLHVTRGSRNIFPWRLVKKRHPVASDLGTAKVLQTRILTEKDLILACPSQFNEDGTNMTMYQRQRVEHAHGMVWRRSRKCAHSVFMEIARASQRREWYWRCAKKSCQSATHSFQLEQVRQEYILVYRVLKFHGAPLAWLKHEVKIVVSRGWG